MKLSVTHVILIACCWLAGCILVAVWIGKHNAKEDEASNIRDSMRLRGYERRNFGSSNRDSQEMLSQRSDSSNTSQNIGSAIAGSAISPSIIHHYLPSFPVKPLNGSTGDDSVEDDYIDIYLDWPLDIRLFTLENYHALESLMTYHPHASFKVLLPFANEVLLSSSFDRTLSPNSFVKYSRLGYDIKVLSVGTLPNGLTSKLGKGYWEKWKQYCCVHGVAISDVTTKLPYHLLMYIRLVKLWKTGGIYSDFSFWLLGPLNKLVIKEGYFIRTTCSRAESLELWQHEEQQEDSNPINPDDSSNSPTCTTSTLLVFHETHHHVIYCVLAQYNSAEFLSCIQAESTANRRAQEGVGCIEKAFYNCFAQQKLQNTLMKHLPGGIDDKYETTVADAEAETDAEAEAETETGSTSTTTATIAVENLLVEDFGGNARTAAAMLAKTSDWYVRKNRRVLWLGELVLSGQWSREGAYPSQSLLKAAFDTLSIRKSPNVLFISSKQSIMKQELPTDNNNNTKNSRSATNSNTGVEHSRCSPSIVVVGFEADYHHKIVELLLTHPLILPPLQSYVNANDLFALSSLDAVVTAAAAQTAAAADVIIEEGKQMNLDRIDSSTISIASSSSKSSSTSSSASSAPSSASSATPSVSLQSAAKTVSFSCYPSSGNIHQLLQRAWCFPFVQPHEPFVVLDSSSSYGTSFDIPRLLKLDNYRNDKRIIFAISDPIKRWERHCERILWELEQHQSEDRDISRKCDNQTDCMNNSNNNNNNELHSNHTDNNHNNHNTHNNHILTCNEIAELGMSQSSSFSKLRLMLANSSASQHDLLTSFYHHVNKHQRSLSLFDKLFVESLAVFPLWYYRSVFGDANVLVVNTDELDHSQLPTSGFTTTTAGAGAAAAAPSAATESGVNVNINSNNHNRVLEDIFLFADLNTQDVDWKLYFSEGKLNTDRRQSDRSAYYKHTESLAEIHTAKFQLRSGTRKRLYRYFAPFVRALSDSTQLNLSSWLEPTSDASSSQQQQLLQQQSPPESPLTQTSNSNSNSNSNNSSSSSSPLQVQLDDFETWFDVIDSSKASLSDAIHRDFSFIHNLLPQRAADSPEQDANFNTTMGLFSMF